MSNKKNKNKDKKGENPLKKNAEKNRMEAAKKRSEDKKKMERNTVDEINESWMKRRQRSLSPIVETPEELDKILKNMNEQESEKEKEKYKSDLIKLIKMRGGPRSTMQEALLQSIASKLKNPNNMGEIKQNKDGTLEFVAYSPTGKGAASRTSKNKRKKTNDKQKKRKKSRGGSTKKRRKKKNITRRREASS